MKHKYISIYVGSEAPITLMGFLLGQKVVDSDGEGDIVEASSMKEACEKLLRITHKDHNYTKPSYLPMASRMVWWNPEGYEGYMVVRMDLLGSLKRKKKKDMAKIPCCVCGKMIEVNKEDAQEACFCSQKCANKA